jgi:uncharacterized protein (DUF2141 family)
MVSKYITVGVSVLILSAIAALMLQISNLSERNDKLTLQLANSTLKNTMQQNIIEYYDDERQYMNMLLTERAKRSIQAESELNETIRNLKALIGDTHCAIPQLVTDELRSGY